MPILALAGPIAGALGASATTAGLIGAAGTVAGGLLSAQDAKKQQQAAAQKAGTITPVDINALNQSVQQQAVGNAALSNQLEQQYNPYISALRQQSAGSLGQFLNPSATDQALQSGLMSAFTRAGQGGSPLPQSPLFANAAQAAQQQLALGGNLDQSTQNQVMRAAAARAGGFAGPGGGTWTRTRCCSEGPWAYLASASESAHAECRKHRQHSAELRS